VALAAAGFEVVACDILEDSLKKGRDLEKRYLLGPHPPIRWREVDLEKEGPPEGPFDLIVSFRYLHRPLLKRISNYLNPAGSLVLETFTTLHRERHGKPSSDDHVLQTGELESLAPGLKVMVADEGWRGGIQTGRLWAVKVESE
jgi:2-polyprenyl-3-methyl-5-hydroxy-6-metoxy-1,4-benzoquinol methylase